MHRVCHSRSRTVNSVLKPSKIIFFKITALLARGSALNPSRSSMSGSPASLAWRQMKPARLMNVGCRLKRAGCAERCPSAGGARRRLSTAGNRGQHRPERGSPGRAVGLTADRTGRRKLFPLRRGGMANFVNRTDHAAGRKNWDHHELHLPLNETVHSKGGMPSMELSTLLLYRPPPENAVIVMR